MALFVILEHQFFNDESTVLRKQLLHVCAVVEELLHDSDDLAAIFEVGGEEVNVQGYVD